MQVMMLPQTEMVLFSCRNSILVAGKSHARMWLLSRSEWVSYVVGVGTTVPIGVVHKKWLQLSQWLP